MLKPIISEKSLKSVQSSNEYTFLVDKNSDKFGVKEAVEKLFGVKVLDVRNKIARGKLKKHGKAKKITRGQDEKHVVVKLAEKDKIDLFETKEQSKSKSKTKKEK
ncbi:MAG: 50S ribosomal protein L23 [Candidatus Blackburnbacteria bacterium RIFCSPHIGHO2_02_FULL_39_13]|uniref:Large ribosomal subunit protein uL23 n=1 Tax=Candidatus Blackburnbacteria bacterium RIFCSPLOWO2_01_FULL_40_20 TaxID=1797519 RepID=A0A1G1VD80_9BACT|nr:MAG: 50S ribosomal protein L23 [Microgenomates group bacterium GW2011_GWA2_39_19]OGY06997.1 MAG: 50S ribosomal protein L23 [Candidatus Blackburnbacteria bacterium RIFCSPHIGHO2_01_FULL_40_17]OGY08510.1 MAG: 50S ribosomal protein L23 [Candidatus Blackburnbacteria bacterium RIFCSPHIGHO2_02_FULL_39_13]OGY13277.1 MAG: 50S ribosomal protein L23 [Candidatus Blackburnbacteria bacterium RIFCSPLOWO2_01_FULL_40_20]OGY15600.1 MAG: 50S ribosomal protein L23 [Candidatus Blackburnbacteria bacterium RIFCSPL